MGLVVRKYFLAGVLLLGSNFLTLGQTNVKEKVYIHLSDNELIVGETLYFSSYVYSAITGRLSNLSSLLYVEILDENYKSVFKTQVALQHGMGAGNYFLPTELETGNYHLVAYTRWMQNFNDLYHQRIVIINPYKPYSNPADKKKDTMIEFYPEGGHLLSDVENHVVIRVVDQFGRGQEIKGRVIDKEGNTLAKVATDSFGSYSFTFVPKHEEDYQLIVESDSGFRFHNLPAPCNKCTQLTISRKGNTYALNLTSPNTTSEFALLVLHNSDTIKTYSVLANSETTMDREDIPNGLIVVILTKKGEKYGERIFWNGDIKARGSKITTETFPTLENASVSVHVDKPASLSVSVKKVTTNPPSGENIAFEYAINKNLESPLIGLEKTDLTLQKLDNLLLSSQTKPIKPLPETVELLPEHQYGIVQGTLTKPSEGTPITGEAVGLSLMGANESVSMATTDSAGRFVLMYNYRNATRLGTVKAMNLVNGAYEIDVNEPFYNSYPRFLNPPVQLDSVKIQELVKRSIDNQIQNAYYLPETASNVHKPTLLSGARSFVLDEYTRFSTMRDTFIELIPEVGVSKNEEKYVLKMRMEGIEFNDKQSAPTLLLLDGVFVSAKEMLEVSPYAVERIDVINRRYYFGKIFFDGVIAAHTFKKDMGKLRIDDHEVKFLETQSDVSSILIQQKSTDRIPHYEHLLLWNPHIEHPGGELKLDFFTSEIEGLFEMTIEGISIEGEPISIKKYFMVKKDK